MIHVKATTKIGPDILHFREPMAGANRYENPGDLCLPSWKPEAFMRV